MTINIYGLKPSPHSPHSPQTKNVRAIVRTTIERLLAVSDDPRWSEYASAWIDGRLSASVFIDYITGEPATPGTFLLDCKVASITAACPQDKERYHQARINEHPATAVFYLEQSNTERALFFADQVNAELASMQSRMASTT